MTEKNKQKLNSQSGFTFIEIIIYLAIVGMVIVGLVTFALAMSGTGNKNFAVQEVQANARSALDILGQKIKMASEVNVDSSVFDSNPGVLSLAMIDGAKDPTIFSIDAVTGALQIQEGADSPVALTSNKVKITSLIFTNLGQGGKHRNISINITVAYNTDSGDISYNYSQTLRTAVTVRK